MQAQTVYCGRCGAPNGAAFLFCGRCGQPLQGHAQPAPQNPARRPPQASPAFGVAPAPGVWPRPAPPAQQLPYGSATSPAPAPGVGYGGQQGYAPPHPGAGGRPQGYAAPPPTWGYGTASPPSPQAGYGGPAWSPPHQTYRPGAYGYPVAGRRVVVPGARGHRWGLWGIAGGLLGVILIGLIVIAVVALRPSPPTCTGPGCVVPPPKGEPLSAPHTYTSSTYHYSVRYYNAPGGYSAGLASRIRVTKQTATGIDWDVDLDGVDPAGGTWPYGFQGIKANGESAQQMVSGVVQQNVQGAQLVYAIPNAMVGFIHGYGAVYNVEAQTSDGESIHSRYIVMGAIQNGVAVVFTALGPYNDKQQEHPDPADTTVSIVVAPLVNGVTFAGEPVR